MVAGGVALPLAVLPMGTANVLAAEIGLSLEPSRIAETIRSPIGVAATRRGRRS